MNCRIQSDDGLTHTIKIPGAYFVPKSKYRVLCLQHWAQTAQDNYPKPRGTWCGTFEDSIELYWNQCKHKKIVWLDPQLNVGCIRSAPGFREELSFCSKIDSMHEDHVLTLMSEYEWNDWSRTWPTTRTQPMPYVSDSDGDSLSEREGDTPSEHGGDALSKREGDYLSESERTTPSEREGDNPSKSEGTSKETFDTNDRTDSLENDISGHECELTQEWSLTAIDYRPIFKPRRQSTHDEVAANTPEGELYRWHLRLGHMPYDRIIELAKRGDIPTKLQNARKLKCRACMYAKAHRIPWRRSRKRGERKRANQPSDMVSIDHLQSPSPGLIAQVKSFLTSKRYNAATFFVDNFSGVGYVYLQEITDMRETLMAKEAFEKSAEVHGVQIKRYHADNSCFKEKTFRQAVFDAKQTITYCGVYAHHQSGIAEKRIWDLQDLARTMLIHAKMHWPEAVHECLWSYALRMACHALNTTPKKGHSATPMEIFSASGIQATFSHHHTFGCPIYAMTTKLQGTGKQHKWLPRTRVGLYLGTSLMHARSIGLVLNLTMGRVLPQFHCKYDDFFETTRDEGRKSFE